MCMVSPDEVTTTMTYLTLGTTIVLYIFPMIFLPILYTKYVNVVVVVGSLCLISCE